MLGTYFTFTELLLWIPLLTGLVAFFIKDAGKVKTLALVSALITLAVSVISLFYSNVAAHPEYAEYHNVAYVWLPYLGSSFAVGMDGIGFLMTFLTALAYPLIIAVSNKNQFQKPNSFFGLLLLSQAGIMGVFVAYDALLFYFFWELALIPVYFLCSRWGEEKRIAATFKFFVYTFLGSLLMLVGIMYVYQYTPAITPESVHSFSIRAFYNANLTPTQQMGIFWLFFAAFAVKIPIFPFHTWQPGVYEQANYPSVMVLSALMVKMGVFGLIRWLFPVFPQAAINYADLVIILSIIGIIYASAIALVQNDLKRFVAWTSIAHLGLLSAGIFANNESGLQGVILEMFNHGINILALWVIVDIVEKKTGVRKLQELRGLAVKAPSLAIFLVIIAFANIGLPLTNSFVSEFLMFNGLFQYNRVFAILATMGIILSSVYMLRIVQFVFFGTPNEVVERVAPISFVQKLVLGVLIVFVLVLGIYPQPVFDLTQSIVSDILLRVQ